MPTLPATRGLWGVVEFAVEETGDSATRTAFDALSMHEKAAVHSTMQLLANTGRVANEERFKHLENTRLFEIRKGQHRFVGGFLPGHRFVIAAYERKKKWKLRAQTIERAETALKRLKMEEEVTCVKPRI